MNIVNVTLNIQWIIITYTSKDNTINVEMEAGSIFFIDLLSIYVFQGTLNIQIMIVV